jgi:hypothetical protein
LNVRLIGGPLCGDSADILPADLPDELVTAFGGGVYQPLESQPWWMVNPPMARPDVVYYIWSEIYTMPSASV